MNPLANILRPGPRAISSPVARAAISDMTYEVIPLKSLPDAIQQLPANARVSVTASPVKPLEDTLDVCAELLDLGHRPIPHLAARKVADAAHLRSLAERIKQLGLSEIFCIADYPDAMSLLRPLLDISAGDITAVGVSSYPDGHGFIDDSALHEALISKQELFDEAGIKGHASTQMCFSTDTIVSWLTSQRAEGLTMPVHLGVAGVVDRAKLIRMGMRLGVGASLRYVQKNRTGLLKLFSSVGYNPSDVIDPLADEFESLGIEGLHMFTFNQVAATQRWQQSKLR